MTRCFGRYVALILGVLGLGRSEWSYADSDDLFTIKPSIVCRRQAGPRDTLCPKLEHLRLRLGLQSEAGSGVRLAYDPFHVAKVTWWDTFGLGVQRLPPQQSWLDDYAIRLRLDTDIELSFEDWSAATLLPDASGMGFSQALQDTGWNQSALRLTWINPDFRILAASLIVGLGEGERLREEDTSPYLGALARIELLDGLILQLGASMDRDALPPASLFWLEHDRREKAARGFEIRRQALALFLDGSNPRVRGLSLSLGWQNNAVRGSAETSLSRVADASAGPFDPTELLAETLGGRSDLTRQTWMLSGSYLILAEYIVAFHLQQLAIDLGDQPLLRACTALDRDGRCLGPASARSRLKIQELTWGFGKKSASGWTFMLESFHERYDQLYELYHFAPGVDQRQQGLQILQLRLSATI